MKLSLAIINDNEALYLKRFFESLGSWKDLLDIVFVDNCSCDNSVQIVKDLGIGNISAFEEKQASRPVLYNAAASRAEGEYVLFTHSDIIFGDGFFENLDKSLKDRMDLDFMNFRVMYVDNITSAPSVVYSGFEDKRIKLSYHSIWGVSDPSFKKLISCSESCFLVDKNVFKYEHFDERYFDTLFIEDLLLKLNLQGANIVYNEDCYVEHYFVEEHERLRTLKYDSRLFIKNNLEELQILDLAEKLAEKDTQIEEKISQVSQLSNALQAKEAEISSLEIQIQQINRGIVIQLPSRYQMVVNKLLPLDSRIRNCYERGLSKIRSITNCGWGSFWSIAKDRLRRKKAG